MKDTKLFCSIISFGSILAGLSWCAFKRSQAPCYRIQALSDYYSLTSGAMEEGMSTHSSILAWRIPMARGACQTTVHGVAKSRT